MKFLNNVDFNKNQILYVKLQNSSESIEEEARIGDAGWIYFNNTNGHIKFFDGKNWQTITDSNTTIVDKYVQSGEILRGDWRNSEFHPSELGSGLALKLTYNTSTHSDPQVVYINITSLYNLYDGANLLLTSGYSVPGSYTAPAANDSMDTVIGKLMKRIDTIVATGGEPNVIDTVKVNGTALTPDSNKAVNILIESCSNQAGHNGDIKVNNAYINVTDLSNYATVRDFMAHGLIEGNGTSTSFKITHNLDCENPVVAIYDNKSKEMVMTNVTVNTNHGIIVDFAVAPSSTDKYDVFIVGFPNISVYSAVVEGMGVQNTVQNP